MNTERRQELQKITKVFEDGMLKQEDIQGVYVMLVNLRHDPSGIECEQQVFTGGSALFQAMLPDLLKDNVEVAKTNVRKSERATAARLMLDMMTGMKKH